MGDILLLPLSVCAARILQLGVFRLLAPQDCIQSSGRDCTALLSISLRLKTHLSHDPGISGLPQHHFQQLAFHAATGQRPHLPVRELRLCMSREFVTTMAKTQRL